MSLDSLGYLSRRWYDMVQCVDIEEEWDFDGSEHFTCSSFTWNKNKTKLRIGITDRNTLMENGLGGKVVEVAPDKYVLIEFNGKNLERLKKFFEV